MHRLTARFIRKYGHPIVLYITLTAILIFSLFPILWTFVTSIKTLPETFSVPPTWIPKTVTFENYKVIWVKYNLLRYFGNSLIVSTISTLISVSLGCLAGYGFSRFTFWGKNAFMGFLLFTQLLPGVTIMIPYFRIIQKINLINTYTSLVIVYCSFSLPFCIWMMKGYFDSIPKSIDEAARIDGCSHLETFHKIVLPLTLPGIASTLIFCFLLGWSEYLFTLILVSRDEMKTITLGIASLIGAYEIAWNELGAMAILASIPVLVAFSFVQKSFMQGLTAGAIKQ
jgi:multiple sugar transport system permease protein